MGPMTRLLRLTVLVAAALSLVGSASAAAAINPESEALVARAVSYLDGMQDVKAPFHQTDQRGDGVDGMLWLARPGRARFQYDPPSDMLITSDGRTVVVSDPKLRSLQRMPLSSTPLAVFLSDHIRLDRGVRVVRVDRTDGGFSITAADARGLAQGQLTLYFADAPLRLAGWAIRDGAGRLTRVALGTLTPVAPPPAGFFTQPKAG